MYWDCSFWECSAYVGKILWIRERLPAPVFWPGEFHGMYSPCDCKESDTTEQLSLHFTSAYVPGWVALCLEALCQVDTNLLALITNFACDYVLTKCCPVAD